MGLQEQGWHVSQATYHCLPLPQPTKTNGLGYWDSDGFVLAITFDLHDVEKLAEAQAQQDTTSVSSVAPGRSRV